MKLLIAAVALLSFVATSTLPETVVAQTASGQTQTAPDQTNAGAPKTTKRTTHRKSVSHKTSSTKRHVTSKASSTKKHTTSKKPATTNPS